MIGFVRLLRGETPVQRGKFLGWACWVSLLCDYIGLRGLLTEETSFGGTWGLCPYSALENLARSSKRLL